MLLFNFKLFIKGLKSSVIIKLKLISFINLIILSFNSKVYKKSYKRNNLPILKM
jgi:hypothetical protein